MLYSFTDSLLAGSGRSFPDPIRKLSANLYGIYHCCVYSEKLLMMERGTVRNMQQTCMTYIIAVCTVKIPDD